MKPNKSILSGVFYCAVLFFITSNSYAQSKHQHKHIIKSNYNYKSYQLDVSLPKNYSFNDTIHYPVLYILDGKFSYQLFSSIQDVFDLGKEIKEVIIVAVDGTGSTDSDWLADRYNDFTPSNIPKADTQWSKIMNIPPGKLKSGGAELFLNTLQNDLIPFISKKYKTTNNKSLSGHSLGGLLTGYCLIKKPDLFISYGINSPSLWWNNNEIVAMEDTISKQNTTLLANVFFSAGALEGNMTISPMNAFINALKSHNYKGLRITSQIFEGESHLSVVPACSSKTLKVFFGFQPK